MHLAGSPGSYFAYLKDCLEEWSKNKKLECTLSMGRKPIQWQSHVNNPTCIKPVYGKMKKIKMLLAGLGLVRIGTNCDLGLEDLQEGFKTSVTVFLYTDLPGGQ